MNKLMVALMVAAIALLASCGPQKADIEAEKAAVKTVLDQYVTSVENEDMNTYGQFVAHDDKMMNFGGFGDPIVGWDALKEVMEGQNEALSETEITVSDMVIHVSEMGNLAWATCLWNLKAIMGENPIELPIRCTWVLEKRDTKWLIVHFHKSMAQGS
jgi:ketosteroid isomerase-like protein